MQHFDGSNHDVLACVCFFSCCWGCRSIDVFVLQESAKIYCLCQQPYDELRPMLSCDHCTDWFHYDCIGLTPPGDDQDDDQVAPAEYRCPKCCLQVQPESIAQP